MSTNKRQFNVLRLQFDNKKVEYYDVLPFFEIVGKKNINLKKKMLQINFHNAIMYDIHKIDIYSQIMMNIDIITDILLEKFKINK